MTVIFHVYNYEISMKMNIMRNIVVLMGGLKTAGEKSGRERHSHGIMWATATAYLLSGACRGNGD